MINVQEIKAVITRTSKHKFKLEILVENGDIMQTQDKIDIEVGNSLTVVMPSVLTIKEGVNTELVLSII